MAIFTYKAYDKAGARKDGEIEAGSREAALEALARGGLLPYEAAPKTAGGPQRWWQREVFGSAMSTAGLALFTRELGTLVAADVAVDEALRIVALQPMARGAMRRTSSALCERVVSGSSLAEAMGRVTPAFPETYRSMVTAAETGGTLGPVLVDLARDLERTAETQSRITAALLYPAVLLLAALTALAVIIGVLLPTLLPLYKDAGVGMPLVVRVLWSIQQFVAGYWPVLLALLALGVIGLIAAWRSARVRAAFDRLLLRLPIVSGFVRQIETARIARTLGSLVRSGVPLLQGLGIVRSVAGNAAYRGAIATAHDAVKEGRSLSAALGASALFPEVAVRLVGIGEQTGQLEAMLERVADIHIRETERQIGRFLTLLGPALTLVMGLLVGGLILSVIGAIGAVNELSVR
jgi:general secretion pathway protein F